MADQMPRVVLIGGNGTGKTLMLETYAQKTAEQNPDDEVIFAINLNDRPLLQLQLENRFEEFENVTVKSFDELDELNFENSESSCSTLMSFVKNVFKPCQKEELTKPITMGNAHICIDEVDIENVPLEDLQKIQAKSLWIVIRDPKSEEHLKENLPGWQIVNLTHPLRTSKRISEKVKEGGGVGYFGSSLQNKFNVLLEIVENMPLGPEPLIIPSSEGTYKVRLQHTCNTVKAKDKSAGFCSRRIR